MFRVLPFWLPSHKEGLARGGLQIWGDLGGFVIGDKAFGELFLSLFPSFFVNFDSVGLCLEMILRWFLGLFLLLHTGQRF